MRVWNIMSRLQWNLCINALVCNHLSVNLPFIYFTTVVIAADVLFGFSLFSVNHRQTHRMANIERINIRFDSKKEQENTSSNDIMTIIFSDLVAFCVVFPHMILSKDVTLRTHAYTNPNPHI